jgi:hypothetical protein
VADHRQDKRSVLCFRKTEPATNNTDWNPDPYIESAKLVVGDRVIGAPEVNVSAEVSHKDALWKFITSNYDKEDFLKRDMETEADMIRYILEREPPVKRSVTWIFPD